IEFSPWWYVRVGSPSSRLRRFARWSRVLRSLFVRDLNDSLAGGAAEAGGRGGVVGKAAAGGHAGAPACRADGAGRGRTPRGGGGVGRRRGWLARPWAARWVQWRW